MDKPWLLPPVPGGSHIAKVWRGMLSRCHDKSDASYARYGGRGIRVCRQWRDALGVRVFAAHIGPCPGEGLTVDRIDNSRGYEPGNVRWATWVEQQNNRRSNVRVTFGGKTLTLAQWAAETGIKRQLIQRRKEDGWALEVAVSTPTGVRKAEAHKRAGIEPAGPGDRT